MKITIIGSAHPLRGGLATFNERLAGALQEQGHEVSIESFSLQYPSFLFPGKSQFTQEPAPAHLRIRSSVNSINPLNWIRTGRRLRKERPDLVIIKYWLPFMGPAFGTLLRIIKKNRHTRVVCIVDNMIPHEKRPGDTAFTRYFIKPVDAFLTMSREVLKDVRSFTDKPSIYTPHPLYDSFGAPVDKQTACIKLGIAPDEHYLLFFGFIRKYKGLDLLLEAMHDPRIRERGYKLLVAGEFYEDRKPYDAIMEEYGLEKQVLLFTEFIPNEMVKYFFCAADLVVQPYKTATQSGITQVAYHFEKPMVVTDVGGLAENVPDGKVGFVTAPEPAAIAGAVLQFYEPGSLPDLQQEILLQKEKYSWETFTDVLFSLLK